MKDQFWERVFSPKLLTKWLVATGKGTSSGLRAFLPEPTSSASSHIHIPVLLCVRFSPGLFPQNPRLKKKSLWRIQWLAPCTFIAEGEGSALGQRTKIPQATHSQKREVPSDADVSRQWGSVWDQILSLAKSVGTGPQEASRDISTWSGATPLPSTPWAHLCRRL